MDDLHKYIQERSSEDVEFATALEEAQPDLEIMKLLVEGRQESGLTQSEVAERCGMKQSNISRLERGDGNPTVGTLQKLARCFGKTLEIRFV